MQKNSRMDKAEGAPSATEEKVSCGWFFSFVEDTRKDEKFFEIV